jgi:peptidoglycan/LPS O-acetylase OafA/YrhL
LFLWLFPVTFGWVGVALFFVLSGFCIHWSFLRKKRFSTADFYRARFWRIYPPYLIALVASTLLAKVNLASDAGLTQFGTHLLLVHNFSDHTFFGINPAFWSLAAECQFYLAYPFFLWVRARVGMERALLAAFILATVIRVTIVVWNAGELTFSPSWFTSPFVLWFDWLLGAYLAERLHAGKSAALPAAGPAMIGLAGFFVLASCFKPLSFLGFTIASLLSVYLVDRCLRSQRALTWLDRIWMPVGLISYSFYLWHQPLIGRVLKVLHLAGMPDTKPWVFAVGFPITFMVVMAFSGILYLTIERGAILIKNRRATPRPLPLPPVAASNP